MRRGRERRVMGRSRRSEGWGSEDGAIVRARAVPGANQRPQPAIPSRPAGCRRVSLPHRARHRRHNRWPFHDLPTPPVVFSPERGVRCSTGGAPRPFPKGARQETHGRTKAAPRPVPAHLPRLPQGRRRFEVRSPQRPDVHPAVRARHERADARPHEPVPVRGARHLPADPDARGARQQQEGHHRGRPERPPGLALPRRARHRAHRAGRRRRDLRRHPARAEEQRRRDRPALPADRDDHDDASAVARQRQGGQPDPGGRHAPRAAAPAARRRAGVEGHQHAHQGAGARARRRGLLQRQGPRGHRAPLLGDGGAARRLRGEARQGHRVVAAGRPHALPDHRPARALDPHQRVRLPRAAGRGAVPRDRQGDPRQARRCCRRSRTTRTRRTTSGASPRATASRTSRSTCS